MNIDENKLAAVLWKLAAMMYECERMTANNANLVVSGHRPMYDTDAFGALFNSCAKELAPSINELLNEQPAATETPPLHNRSVGGDMSIAQRYATENSMLRADRERLEWMLRNVSGREYRRLGIVYHTGCTRADIDRAMCGQAHDA